MRITFLMIMFRKLSFAGKLFLSNFVLTVLAGVGLVYIFYGYWFAGPFGLAMGGGHLLGLTLTSFFICGPGLAAILLKSKKTRRELYLDFALVVGVQAFVLAGGLYVGNLARPRVLVYEVDRFVLVSMANVNLDLINQAPEEFTSAKWWGHPILLGVRKPHDGAETLRSIELSILGEEPSLRPQWWQAYDLSREEVKNRMKSLAQLFAREPDLMSKVNGEIGKKKIPAENLYYLPLISDRSLDDWSVILDAQANVVGYAEFGGFR